MSKQSLIQKQTQKLHLTPQQIQLCKLIEMPTMELAADIEKEIEANPALEFSDNQSVGDDENIGGNENESDEVDDFDENQNEENNDPLDDFSDYMNDDDEDDAAYKYAANNSSPDDEYYQAPISNEVTFQDMLLEQLSFRQLDERSRKIGEFIIGSLDDSGYLTMSVDSISDVLDFKQNMRVTPNEIRSVLAVIQEFDPAGVGAENIQECLALQLHRLDEEDLEDDYDNALNIIENYFQEYTQRHFDKILAKSRMTEDELKAALEQIQKLNPKPGGSASTTTHNTNFVIPDFAVYANGDKLELVLNGRNSPDVHVSKEYMKDLAEYVKKRDSKAYRDAANFMKEQIDLARNYIDLINQRRDTLYVTMKAIMDRQYDFFMTGDESKLKPMILEDIANAVGLDISTISRVTNSKYVQTAYGTFKLKFFFSEGIKNDAGEEVSTRGIKQIIKESIENEDKTDPLTDDELTAIVKQKGFTIARRTTAKYREQLGYLSSSKRREI